MRVYAIGDIHGHLSALQAAHDRICRDSPEPNPLIVHVGDLIDRGPDSRGVIEWMMQGQAQGRRWLVIRGNHDRMLPDFLDNPHHIDPGIRSQRSYLEHPDLGAAETLASYGVFGAGLRPIHDLHAEAVAAVPRAHYLWLRSLPCWYLHPLALFVHAGIRPGVDLTRQAEDDLVWIRREFLDDPRNHGTLVVHGHTPLRQSTYYGNRLNIDSGAGYGRPLSAVVLESDGLWLLGEQTREPVTTGGY